MADLLKMLSYLEGELQAREVVIATLKVSSKFDIFLQFLCCVAQTGPIYKFLVDTSYTQKKNKYLLYCKFYKFY